MIPEINLRVQVKGTQHKGIIINTDARRDTRLGTHSKILFVTVRLDDGREMEYEVHDLQKI